MSETELLPDCTCPYDDRGCRILVALREENERLRKVEQAAKAWHESWCLQDDTQNDHDFDVLCAALKEGDHAE